MLGLCICAGSAVLIALGFLLPGGLLLLFASGFDILDGALARVSGREQRYGAFLDSTVDRYAEAITYIALLAYFIFHGHHTLEPMLIVFALTGSLLVSYVRARAQSLGFNGDGGWLASYAPPALWAAGHIPLGRARVYGDGTDVTIVTFGNGLRMSLRAASRLSADGIGCRVVDLRWLAPLPVADVLREASVTGRVLVADETRRTGGVSEGVITALADAGFPGLLRRVTSEDSFIPIGDAATTVLLSQQAIETAARDLIPGTEGAKT